MKHEVLEELKLLRGDVEQPVVDGNPMAEPIHRDRPVVQKVEPLGPASTVKGTDPCEQLVKLEGLGQVVVGARIQPAHHVLGRIARSQHQDRCVPAFPAELGRDLEAVFLGEDYIEQDHVVVVHVRQHRRLITVRSDVHHVALFLQALLDESGDLPVVLYDENLHGGQASQTGLTDLQATMKISLETFRCKSDHPLTW